MKKMIGSPGTMSGLILRLGQCATAAASIGVMVSAPGFSSYTAFWWFWIILSEHSLLIWFANLLLIMISVFAYIWVDLLGRICAWFAHLKIQPTKLGMCFVWYFFWLMGFQLLSCIYGSSNDLELWTCVSWRICHKAKKRLTKPHPTKPLRSWWLGTNFWWYHSSRQTEFH